MSNTKRYFRVDKVDTEWYGYIPQLESFLRNHWELNCDGDPNLKLYGFGSIFYFPKEWCTEVDEQGNELGLKYAEDYQPKTTHRTFDSGSIRDNDTNKPLVNHLDAYLRLRYGYLLREGARKYGSGNWKLGQSRGVALESLHRHLAKYECNLEQGIDQDEDHLAAIIFNVMLCMKNDEKEGIQADHFFKYL